MKAKILFAFAVAVLASACNKVEVQPDVNSEVKSYTYTFGIENTETKALIDTDHIKWEASDKIGVFVNGTNNNIIGTVSDDVKSFSITVNDNPLAAGDKILSYYPYDEENNDNSTDMIFLTIPSSQEVNENGYDADAMPQVATEFVVESAEVGAKVGDIRFYNLGAVAAFKVYNTNYTSERIQKISFCADNLAGQFMYELESVDPSDVESLSIDKTDLGEGEVTVNVKTPIAVASSKDNATTIYMVVAPGSYSEPIVTVETDKAKYTLKAPIDINFTRSNITPIDITLSSAWDREVNVKKETYTFGAFTQGYDVTLDAETFSITFHKNTGSTSPQWNANSEEARLYAKGSVEITSTKDIKKIVYNYTVNANNSGKAPTVDGVFGSTNDGEWNVAAKTWTGSDNTVTLSTSGEAGNLGFKSVTVYFSEENDDEGEPTEYNITLPTANNGTLVSSHTKAVAGTEITITATPSVGYSITTLTAGVEGEVLNGNILTFTMPTADVNVSVAFGATGTITTMSADDDADIKFTTGSSSTTGAIWANSTPLTANNITLSGSVTSGSNYSYYDGSVVRFYANNELVITPSDGVSITKIEIVRQSTTSSNTGTINCSGLTASSQNTTTNTNVYTGSTTEAVTISNTAQSRFTKIIVYSTGGKTVQSVSVSGNANKKTYTAGDKFETTGLVATATFDDNTTQDVTDKATWTVTPETIATSTTSVSVVATYNNVSSEAITVSGIKVLTSISVKTAPAKVVYTEGDMFDPTGLVITRNYSDGSSDDCSYADNSNDFSFNPTLATALSADNNKVTITYQTKSAEQEITVNYRTYSSLESLATADLTTGTIVNVSFENVPIKSIYVTSGGYRNGIYFNIQKEGKDIEIFYKNVPAEWVPEGTVSGSVTCPWKKYNGTWELAPDEGTWDWNNLAYTAPLTPCETPVITISDSGSATISCATEGASIYYTIGESPADPTNESTPYEGVVSMTDGQTIKAIAYKDGMKPSEVVSKTYSTTQKDEYSFTIQTSDFNTTSYAANNGSHDFTAICTTDATKTMTIACTTNQIMKNSNNMQWQKNAGYIYNTKDLGTIKSVTVNSTAGTFTTYYGTEEHPTSGTTVGNGFFTINVGNATGTTSSIVVVFEK